MARVRFRTRQLPRVMSDWASFGFLILMIPVIYWFEVFIVLPWHHPSGTFAYAFHVVAATFVLVNLCSNLLAAILVDPSTKGLVLSSHQGVIPEGWHFCAVCESVAPPRARHCHICDVCIIRRDHHCMFTGCCIGRENLRYFIAFLVYLWIATAYSTILNHSYVWSSFELSSLISLFRLMLPLIALFAGGLGAEGEATQLHILLYAVNIVGFLLATGFLIHHMRLAARGLTTGEAKHITEPKRSTVQNLCSALGHRWFVAWICPIIKSTLPQEQWASEPYRKSN